MQDILNTYLLNRLDHVRKDKDHILFEKPDAGPASVEMAPRLFHRALCHATSNHYVLVGHVRFCGYMAIFCERQRFSYAYVDDRVCCLHRCFDFLNHDIMSQSSSSWKLPDIQFPHANMRLRCTMSFAWTTLPLWTVQSQFSSFIRTFFVMRCWFWYSILGQLGSMCMQHG